MSSCSCGRQSGQWSSTLLVRQLVHFLGPLAQLALVLEELQRQNEACSLVMTPRHLGLNGS